MRGLLVFTLCVAVTAAYGPPRPANNGCGNGGCGGGQPVPIQTVSCGGNGCGGSTGGGSGSSGSGDYWWAGGNSPFDGPPASHVSVSSGSGSAKPHPVRPVSQPQQGYIQPRPVQAPPALPQLPSTQNLVQPPMGICPARFVCVHWQLCRDGFVISDGTGTINKRIKEIPVQVSSRHQSCGGDMICCGIPAGGLPASLPAPQPQRPPVISQPQILAPAPQPFKPAPQPAKPAPQPPKPLPQPATPVFQPARPAPRPPRPNPSVGYSGTPPQNPLVLPAPSQPNPQPTVVNSANPVPGRPYSQPISNPVGLVSPPSPQPNPMNGGMMMMMMGMPMRGGSCSAGTYCVQQNMCNPYTGFIIRDPSQLMAVWPDAPTVPLLPCFVPDGSVQNGVCCQEAHPNAGGFD